MADILWTRAERSPRGPQPSLSRDQIAAAAIGIADREGLDAVSMRRVATELRCGTMSLYRYVRTKDELYDLMRDAVAGEDGVLTAEPSGDWRADLRTAARAMRASVLRHPWLPALIVRRPAFGPNEMRGIELMLTVLDSLGLSADEKLNVIGALGSFVQGYAQRELAEREWRGPDSRADKQWQLAMARYLAEVTRSGAYPQFTRVRDEADKVPDPDAVFEWQLDRILDGLAPVVSGHAPPVPGPAARPARRARAARRSS